MIGFELYFPLFEAVLHGSLNPSLEENVDGHHYKDRMQDIISVSATDTGLYKSFFPPPHDFKTRYYYKLHFQVCFGHIYF